MQNQPIGIFDSGIGGLTVAKQIITTLPDENIIYLGDTARVPYGTRGKEVITKFAFELVDFLLNRDVKCLVVACNTISATCLDEIVAYSPVPVIGVIKPTVEKAVQSSKTKKIGAIGTRATVSSDIYNQEINKIDPSIQVLSQACPLFVPLAEEGLFKHSATEIIAKEYLKDFSKIDTLILGCTHYPLLRDVIQKTVGKNVQLIDSAKPTAEQLKKLLQEKNLLHKKDRVKRKFFVTDLSDRTQQIASTFFGNKINIKLEKVSL